MYWIASALWAIAVVLSAELWFSMRYDKAIRLGLLLALSIGVGTYAYLKVERVRDSYQDPTKALSKIAVGEEDTARKSACEQMNKQNEQFQSWSVLILGAIVAILVTTKVHRLKHFGWAYLPLGPATILLVGSLRGGWIFSRRFAYIVAKNNFELSSLSALGEVQSDLFLYSMIFVGLFAITFLIFIVLEVVEPFEKEKL